MRSHDTCGASSAGRDPEDIDGFEDEDGLAWKHFCNLAEYEVGNGVFKTDEW